VKMMDVSSSTKVAHENRILRPVEKGRLFRDLLLGPIPFARITDHSQKVAVGHFGHDHFWIAGSERLTLYRVNTP